MSRTDKDAPIWQRQKPWTAKHHPSCHGARRDCDLPPGPPRRLLSRRRRYPLTGSTACYWSWPWPVDFPALPSAPNWYIAHVWTRPQRQQARMACIEARKEHRGGGPVDAEPFPGQHRNCANYYWW